MSWLATLVEANPAAVPLWWLYLRAVQKAESPQFTQVLHRCAALSPNRSALMAWVEEPLQPVASGEVVSSTQVSSDLSLVSSVSSELVSGETVSGDSFLVPGDSPGVLDQAQQETSTEEPQVASNEEPASAEKEQPARPEPKATNAATLNLDALPERVRDQILRARAARAQLAEVGFGSAPSAPKVETVAAVLPKVETVAAVPPKVEPVPAAPKPLDPTPEPKPVPPALRTSEPAAKKPKQQTAQASQVANEPTLPTSPSSLSPFAQFVANLEGSSTPKGSELIDQFLSANPKISSLAKDAPAPEVRTEPDANVTGLVTETLARMYAEQGHVAKAIQAYEILKLRVPEKSSIFAARIEALKTK
jgi:hypothetical protein